MDNNTLINHLHSVLMKDNRFRTDDGQLIKNAIVEAALNVDATLISYLLSDELISRQFFTTVNDVKVFDKVRFQRFVMNKSFLPDSYTAYKNKVGLTNEDGDFLSESREVVLSWPYKDCVLEGGQTKEDAKRDEIFWNETLAPDEINRIFEPKALTNFRLFNQNGEHEVSTISKKDNLIIKGNNLLALHSLKKVYAGQVKLIYIDPPYNTGNDSFGYNDSFNHSTWLTFMKNRLEVAKELLKEDGVLCVQCDDNEQAYLKVLLDNTSGLKFINNISVKMSEASGLKMNHAKGRFPKLKEYILIYVKPQFKGFECIDKYQQESWDRENNLYLEGLTQEQRDTLINIELKDKNDENDIKIANEILSHVKLASLSDVIKQQKFNSEEQCTKWLFENSYHIIKTAGSTGIARLMHENVSSIPNQDIAAFLSKKSEMFFYLCHFNLDTKQPRLQVIFADENIYKNPCDFWQDIRTTGAIANEGGTQLCNGKKPEKLLYRLIKMMTKENDYILDFFQGSGTTAAVAHKMGRRYIGCEQIETQIDLIITRLKNVINGDQSGVSKTVGWDPQHPTLMDGDKYANNSFVYCELANANQTFVDKIIAAEDSATLQNLWKQIQQTGFMSYKVQPKEIDKNVEDFVSLSLDDQKRFLIECLDMNLLYIPYSDMNDNAYSLSDNDKQLTNQFYSLK